MNDYIIFTDSTTDLTPDMITTLEVQVMSLTYSMNNKTYKNTPDHSDMDIKIFYDNLRNGDTATTAQINPSDMVRVFEPVLQDGNDILYIAFSSGLSGTYQSACIAAKELNQQYPNHTVKVVDSLAASMGEGLLLYLAVMKKREGLNITQLKQWVTDNRNHLCHWFTVDDLHHLKRGGRVSAGAAVIGSALNIKPVMHMDNDGHLIPVRKVRGRKQSLTALVTQMEQTALSKGSQDVFISHADCINDAKFVEQLVLEKFPQARITINFIGPVIGAHSGPGTVALFFLGTEK
ncbi:MAG TPA: DegV family protein [Clostridiales bacterium]|nr:DegV family protein [Clostridiales bacterium]